MSVSVKTVQLLEASILGTKAFKSGLKRIPVLDKELHKFFKGAVGETIEGEASIIEIMTAWLNAWDNANFSKQ